MYFLFFQSLPIALVSFGLLIAVILIALFCGAYLSRKLNKYKSAIRLLRYDVDKLTTAQRRERGVEESASGIPTPTADPLNDPRFTYSYEDERVDRYSSYTSPLSTYEAVQSVYEDIVPATIVPVEEIKIGRNLTKAANPKPVIEDQSSGWARMRRLRRTIMHTQARPTSTVQEGATQYPKKVPGLFVTKSIGILGGEIKIHGIELKIPTGALTSTTTVRLGFIWDKKVYPKLNKTQASLSPVIVCEPNGLVFRKPVKLRIPHCASDAKSAWQMTVMHNQEFNTGDSESGRAGDWSTVTIDDYWSILKEDDHVDIDLKHFTLYTVVGESAKKDIVAKKVQMVAFATPVDIGEFFKVWVYCVNDYNTEMPVSIDIILEGCISFPIKTFNSITFYYFLCHL